jgi:hypothetical protein
VTHVFEDESFGLKLKGYGIVPNGALETSIAIYTSEIVQSILLEHPEIVDRWLQKLHTEYISKKKSCDFENDPVACFTLSVYEEFEKHFKSWEDGGLIAITLPQDRVIRVSKKPLISMVSDSKASYLVCSKCMYHTVLSHVEVLRLSLVKIKDFIFCRKYYSLIIILYSLSYNFCYSRFKIILLV